MCHHYYSLLILLFERLKASSQNILHGMDALYHLLCLSSLTMGGTIPLGIQLYLVLVSEERYYDMGSRHGEISNPVNIVTSKKYAIKEVIIFNANEVEEKE